MGHHYLIKYFNFSHLPKHLQDISKFYYELACEMDKSLPDNPEKTVALRKLLESKDCAVRSML